MMRGEPVDESEVVEGNPVQGGEEWVEIEVRQFGTIAEAQTAVSFTLRQPGYLPEGYAFGRAKVWGEGHFAFANLHFDGPDGEIMLSQRLVGGQPGQTVSIGLPSDYVIETVQVNGHTAAWAEHVLLWEANSISYLLSGPDLSMAEATRIAESLE